MPPSGRPAAAEPAGGPVLGARSARIGELRRLVERRAHREQSRRFVIDGPVLVAEALPTGLVEGLYVDVDAVAPAGRFAPLIAAAQAAGVPVDLVAAGVLARVADPVSPQPVVAVVARPATPSAEAVARAGGGVLVCDGVADPGNLGTLVRVAEAAGMSGVWVVGRGTDPFGPKAVRASAGSVLRVPVAVVSDGASAVGALAAAGHVLVGLRGDGDPYDTAPMGSAGAPVALVVGSEAHGISTEVAAGVQQWVGIPMSGSVESLNAGVAGAVVALELARRRRTGSGPTSAAR